MNTEPILTVADLDRKLTELGENLRAQVPARHPLSTDACPSLSRFPDASDTGWTETELPHVRGCRYCQRMIAIAWRETKCPSLHSLRQHARSEYRFPEAMRLHLQEDGCRRCSLVLRATERWRDLTDALAAYGELPSVQPGFAPARAPFRAWNSQENGLSVTLRETEPPEHALVVNIDGPPEMAGAVIRVVVIGESESIEQEIALETHEHGVSARHVFGKFKEWSPKLGADCAVLAAVLSKPRA